MATRRVLLRADWVYDDALVRGLVAAERTCALHAADGSARRAQRRRRRRRRSGGAARGRPAPPTCGPGRDAPPRWPTATTTRCASASRPICMPLTTPTLPAIEAARLRQLVQGRHRLGHALRLAATRARWSRACAPTAGITPNMVTSAEPGAGAGGDVGCSGHGHYALGPGGRLGHDLPRHGRRQAGARHAAAPRPSAMSSITPST